MLGSGAIPPPTRPRHPFPPPFMSTLSLSLQAGWLGMLGGIVSGALIGLAFHRPGWLGGYDAFPRRMVRLGHISFFGLGLLQLCYGFTLAVRVPPEAGADRILAGCLALVVAQVTMPLCCFLTAWKPAFRHGFPLPVLAAAAGVLTALIWLTG